MAVFNQLPQLDISPLFEVIDDVVTVALIPNIPSVSQNESITTALQKITRQQAIQSERIERLLEQHERRSEQIECLYEQVERLNKQIVPLPEQSACQSVHIAQILRQIE